MTDEQFAALRPTAQAFRDGKIVAVPMWLVLESCADEIDRLRAALQASEVRAEWLRTGCIRYDDGGARWCGYCEREWSDGETERHTPGCIAVPVAKAEET